MENEIFFDIVYSREVLNESIIETCKKLKISIATYYKILKNNNYTIIKNNRFRMKTLYREKEKRGGCESQKPILTYGENKEDEIQEYIINNNFLEEMKEKGFL